MKFKNMPSANETRASGESILKTAREMWATTG
ncbi:hypothetical protein IANJMKHF_00002 [Klebsiella phage CPRSA]|nr:hypothetical protein IANJMKHF_00002 [Klebsiella phage CPRSA]